MKKTLVLTHEYWPFKGGVARYVYNLFKNFEPKDYLVLCDHPAVSSKDNIFHFKLRDQFVRPTWLLRFWSVINFIQKNKIEIIFTPNILPLGGLCWLIYKLYKIPYVISLHGLDIRLAKAYKGKWAGLILRNAQNIVVNSLDTQKVLLDYHISGQKITLLYPGVDLPQTNNKVDLNALRNKHQIKKEEKVLLTVARLQSRKGQDLVIKALGTVAKDLKVKYIIIGEGPNKNDLEQLIKYYKLSDKVIILDNISHNELNDYYQLADLFVMPNRRDDLDVEGFGIVFMEAASHHLPIIAGNNGGIPEVWENNVSAKLIDSVNLNELAEAIRLLLNNESLAKKMAEAAYQNCQKFPSSKTQSEKLKNILS